MSFLDDASVLDATKTDVAPAAVRRPDISAEEWNHSARAAMDLRTGVLEGQYTGLVVGGTAAVAPTARVRTKADAAGRLTTSAAGDRYRTLGRPSHVHVRDYGAVGDGTTDDTAAIQAAIDDSIGRAAKLLFEPLTYRCVGPLHVWGISRLEGEGRWRDNPTVLSFPAGCPGLMMHSADSYGLRSGIHGGWSQSSSVRGIKFLGTGTTAVGLLTHARVKVTECAFEGWGAGFKIQAGHYCTRAVVTSKTGWMPGTFSAAPSGATGEVEFESAASGSALVWLWVESGTLAPGDTITVGAQTCTVSSVTSHLTNANNVQVSDVWCYLDALGLRVRGGDANSCAFRDVEVMVCALGIHDSSFFGSLWDHPHTEGCTVGMRLDGPAQTGLVHSGYSENLNPCEISAPNEVRGGWWAHGWVGAGGGVPAYGAAGVYEAGHMLQAQFIHGAQMGYWKDSSAAANGAIQGYTDGRYGRSFLKYRDDATGESESRSRACYYWNVENSPGAAVGYALAAPRTAYGPGGRVLVAGIEKMSEVSQGLLNFPFAFYLDGRRHGVGSVASLSTLHTTWDVGAVLWEPTPTVGNQVARVCVKAGTSGTYASAVTATADGTTTVVLSAIDPAQAHQIKQGEYLTIHATAVRVEAISGTTVTTDVVVPAGSGLAIAYTPPVWGTFGVIS